MSVANDDDDPNIQILTDILLHSKFLDVNSVYDSFLNESK